MCVCLHIAVCEGVCIYMCVCTSPLLLSDWSSLSSNQITRTLNEGRKGEVCASKECWGWMDHMVCVCCMHVCYVCVWVCVCVYMLMSNRNHSIPFPCSKYIHTRRSKY